MSIPLPAPLRRSLLVYNLFFPLAFLFLLPNLLRRMLRRGNYQAKFGQRFGRYGLVERKRFAEGAWRWIHSISVGETLVALKLAAELHQRDPHTRIVISVTTSTGFALAREQSQPWLEVIYNPLDLRSIVRSALDQIRPVQLLFIEGEAWPNLVAEAARRGIVMALVNARLSPRSQARFRRFRKWTGPIFAQLDLICVPEVEDVARWQSLGALRVAHSGSIKFDLTAQSAPPQIDKFRDWLAPLGVDPTTPILVAGSTWAPEEAVLAQLLPILRQKIPNLFLILVPRHVERTPDLLAALARLNLRICRRTSLPLAHSQPSDVLLVDSTGELRDWYALGSVVFVGKSLPGVREVGGQNPAEPAALGKAVVVGPHMENFAAVMDLLRGREGILQVTGEESLGSALNDLLTDETRRQTMGKQAQAALEVHQEATARTAILVLGLQAPGQLATAQS